MKEGGVLFCCDFCGYACDTSCGTCRHIYCCVNCQKDPTWLNDHGKICASTLAQRFRNVCRDKDFDFVNSKDSELGTTRNAVESKVFYTPNHKWFSWAKSAKFVDIEMSISMLEKKHWGYDNIVCIGCGLRETNAYFLNYRQTLFLKQKNVDLYYCDQCASEDRFLHPDSLMTLRETWIVFSLCWIFRLRMRKDLLQLLRQHFQACWRKDIDVEDIRDNFVVPVYDDENDNDALYATGIDQDFWGSDDGNY